MNKGEISMHETQDDDINSDIGFKRACNNIIKGLNSLDSLKEDDQGMILSLAEMAITKIYSGLNVIQKEIVLRLLLDMHK